LQSKGNGKGLKTRGLGKNLEMPDVMHRLAAQSLPPSASGEAFM